MASGTLRKVLYVFNFPFASAIFISTAFLSISDFL